MDVGLHACHCAAQVHLRVTVVPVVGPDRKPPIEVITIPNEQSAGVRGTFENTVTRAVSREKSRALDAHL
jgi:hypothetical protein